MFICLFILFSEHIKEKNIYKKTKEDNIKYEMNAKPKWRLTQHEIHGLLYIKGHVGNIYIHQRPNETVT